MTDISEMTSAEFAAETARLRGWELCFGTWRMETDSTDGRPVPTGYHNIQDSLSPTYWDPANRIEHAQELVEEVKKRGLLDEFVDFLTGEDELESSTKFMLWWFKHNPAEEICRAFIVVMEEANG